MFCIRFSTFVFFLIVLSILLFSVINPRDSTWGFVGAELRVKVCFVLLNKWHILSRPAQCNYSDVIFSQTRMSSTKLPVSVLLCSCLWLIFFQKRKFVVFLNRNIFNYLFIEHRHISLFSKKRLCSTVYMFFYCLTSFFFFNIYNI